MMIKRLFREPLLHFFLVGAALFFIDTWRGEGPATPLLRTGTTQTRINVTQEDMARIKALFIKTWQHPPSEAEQKVLVEDFIRNEIFYREALSLGLDKDDEVLKRRLRQKMEFIYEEITALAEPSDEQLQAFMERHRDKYLADPLSAFHQVYIDTTRRGSSAIADARTVLAQLRAGADPRTAGDTTMLAAQVPLSPLGDIQREFGEEFAQSLLKSAPGSWTGPIRSAYGLHLVYVGEHIGARLPDLDQIRERVKQDWLIAEQKALRDGAYRRIRERYTVTVEAPDANTDLVSAADKNTEATQ